MQLHAQVFPSIAGISLRAGHFCAKPQEWYAQHQHRKRQPQGKLKRARMPSDHNRIISLGSNLLKAANT